jgi:hypothetical protein
MKAPVPFIALAALALTARAAEPLVTFSVDPEESGQMIYAPMGRLSAADPPTGRLWFKVNVQNNDDVDLTLTSIRVTLTGIDVSIPTNEICPAGETTVVGDNNPDGTTNQIITVPHPAPASVTVRLYFAPNPTPKQIVRPLVPYVPATPGGKYYFPANEGDIAPDEYFSGGSHAEGIANSGAPIGMCIVSRRRALRITTARPTKITTAGESLSVRSPMASCCAPIRASTPTPRPICARCN